MKIEMPSAGTNLSRIGVIGDIHADAPYLLTALEFLARLNLEAVFCTGDIVDGPESVDDCCRMLRKYRVLAVAGNRDQWFLANEMRSLFEATHPLAVADETREYIRALPLVREFNTVRGSLLLCHGIGPNTMKKVRDDDEGYALESNFELQEIIHSGQYRFMVNGHTHYRMVRNFGGLTVINAGAVKREHNPCFLTIDFSGGVVRYYNIATGLGLPVVESGKETCLF